MTFEVIILPAAEIQALDLEAWWLDNRPKNPLLFEEEFSEALGFLEREIYTPTTWL